MGDDEAERGVRNGGAAAGGQARVRPLSAGADSPLADLTAADGGALSLAAEDLRGPAQLLLRHARQLRDAPGAPLSAPARRALAALEREAERVAGISTALLELQALERGQVQLGRSPVDLASLLGALVEERRAEARGRGIELQLDLPDAPVEVSADPERLARAARVLLDCGVSITPREGRLQLSLEASPRAAYLTLETRASARRPAARGRRLAGTGLGFALARRVAELHGGSLDLVRRAGGVEARLVVPVAAPSTARVPARADAGARGRLLVVDDDADARAALSMILGDDYEVQLAADGQEAVERAAADRPDVVLMDLYMPRMDGLAALEALRADPGTAGVPVILISGRGDELTRSRSLDLGAVDFLQKPFSVRELKSRIERTLRLTRRESELQELARTDPLTGLANLRAFRGRLDEEVKRAHRYRTPLACVMVDMDNLKPINDELGHAAGDQAIRALADVIRRELRETDFGARYGGDEFVLLLPHTSGQEARVFAERVCARLREAPLEIRGRPLPISASFGIAALGDEHDEAGELLVRRADGALYAAKRAGRGRVAAHAPGEQHSASPAP